MRALILVMTALLIFGCLGIGGTTGPTGGSGVPQLPGGQTGGTTPPVETCTPEYSFYNISDGVLGHGTTLTATVTCAAGKTITVKLDGELAAASTVPTNDTTTLELALVPTKEGTLQVTADSDATSLLTRDWTVAPLGSSDLKGVENDGISFKEWRGMAFEVDGPVSIGRARMYLKRLEFQTQPNTNMVAEIRSDSGGTPGAVVGSVKKPITATTLSDNWINFDFASPVELQRGKYWIVLRMEQTESVDLISDTVYLHYVAVDKQSEGNDYTRQMILSVDSKTGQASETSWAPLSYDRVYSVTLHGVQ